MTKRNPDISSPFERGWGGLQPIAKRGELPTPSSPRFIGVLTAFFTRSKSRPAEKPYILLDFFPCGY
ncbi:hypothetical protein N7468_004310 [Penicillium chermesinum]|uniref:Uncharacterized protein n=1 Tax=Penicillium chermesinum TaxID=63820 RepID=A0A9W9TSG1_9EURO|nr:uncharacterized protein N7468_004310 [Penicillium chermesinum]KAJ5239691.1 hypothetical protein N7468_004310 [Penicillium chermesinum]